MASEPPVLLLAAPAETADRFQTGTVLTIAGAHLVHDTFSAFLSPLLPLLVDKLALSLTVAGALPFVFRLPSTLNPLIGVWADRIDLRLLVILAPAVTAAAMSLIGLAPNLGLLILLMLIAGLSSCALHVPGPVIVARTSGRRVGAGMSVWMMTGELARTIGPLLAVAVVSWRTLEGYYPVMALGMATSLVLFLRLRRIDLQGGDGRTSPRPLGEAWRATRRLMLPLAGFLLLRAFLQVAFTTFLPILVTSAGQSLWSGGTALATVEFAGAVGAMAAGAASDRLDRRLVLAGALLLAPVCTLLFLSLDDGGAVRYLLLALTGFLLLSSTPVVLAMVQDVGRDSPATANGIYMGISFLIGAAASPVVGWVADRVGLPTAFTWSAVLALAASPVAFFLPSGRQARPVTSK